VRHRFSNRSEAGRCLAAKLMEYADRGNVLVLGLPRGGVPVAYEIALALNAPLDVFLVQKLRVPFSKDLAIGAIASGGVRILNLEIIRQIGVTASMVEAATAEERVRLEHRAQLYRPDRPPLEIDGHVIVLVDDGIASGASIKAAVLALRLLGAARIVVAVPVGRAETCAQFKRQADEIVSCREPKHFAAVGGWYADIPLITDEEVFSILERRAQERRLATTLSTAPTAYREVLTHDG